MAQTVLLRVCLIGLSAGICGGLTRVLEPLPAFVAWSVATAVACLIGMRLLQTSTVGRIDWRNRVAGWLLPWGGRLNRGRLWPIPLTSWVVWVLLGAAVIVIREYADDDDGFWPAFLFLSWVVDGEAFLYVLGTAVTSFPGRSSSGRSLVWILLALSTMATASLVLYLTDRPALSVLVAGGPPLTVGLGFALFFAAILFSGRNARWN